MVSLKLALGALMSATLAVAHMELIWPLPLHSRYNPNTPNELIGEWTFRDQRWGHLPPVPTWDLVEADRRILTFVTWLLTRDRVLHEESLGFRRYLPLQGQSYSWPLPFI